MSTLRVYTEQAASDDKVFELDQAEVTIGRDRQADIQIDPGVTTCARGIHARLRRENGRWIVQAEHRFGVIVHDATGERFISQGTKQSFRPPARIRLGRAGPWLRVESGATRAETRASEAGEPPRTALPGGPVTVRIISGAAAPWSRIFDGDRVRIGRGADADVRLDPHRDTAVASGIHAELVRQPEGWVLECRHHSGLVLQFSGQSPQRLRAGERCLIAADARVILGRRGPMIELLVPQPAEDVPATLVAGDERYVLDLGAPGTTPVAGGAAVELPGWLRPVGSILPRAAARWLAQNTAAATIGGAAGALGLAALLGILLWNPTNPEQQLQRVLEEARPSVYTVGEVTPAGFDPFGTAWVAAPGILGTNSHVTEGVQELLNHGKVVEVRQPGPNGRRARVVSVKSHPGYIRWNPIVSAQGHYDKNLQELDLMPIYDVGLLKVDGDVGPPLPLASPEELASLEAGDVVGVVSYPSESIRGIHSARPATIATGHITAFTHEFGEAASADNWHMLEHDIVATGGSSGSPILDARGRVVAVLNAGHVVGTITGRVSVGINVGQNVLLLRQLLDDTAEAHVRERTPELVQRLRNISCSAEQRAVLLALRVYRRWAGGDPARTALLRKKRFETVWETSVEFREGSSSRRSGTVKVTLEPGSVYVLAVAADDFSLVDANFGTVNGYSMDDRHLPVGADLVIPNAPVQLSLEIEEIVRLTPTNQVKVVLLRLAP